MQGRKEIQPKMMYHVTLDSLVAQDNFYRRLNSELDLSFLYKETARYYGSEGQESIDPVVFFKICLVGYLNNITSDRKLIEACANRLDIRLYIKYDLDEALPWHSTISRTRQLYGEEVFLCLFRKVLSMCVKKGMVRGKRQAVDSVFVKANASMDSLVERQVSEDAAAYAEELDEGSEYRITSAKKDGGPVDKKGGKTCNKTHYSPTDPDARISMKGGKPCQLNYYGQVSVDDANHVITGAGADFADQRDCQCLENIVGQTMENLGADNLWIGQLLADTNYSSGAALRYLEEKGIDAYIPSNGAYRPDREGFVYNAALDRYECTRGNKAVLGFVNIVQSVGGHTKKVYLSGKQQCKGCALMEMCAGKAGYKKITETTDKPYYDRMHAKMRTPYGKKTARIRGKTVEPVLGTLVNFLGMKKVNTKGIRQANKHVLMASLCYNLKKYLKFTAKKVRSAAIALMAPTKPVWRPDLAYMASWKQLPA
jgi:transposase